MEKPKKRHLPRSTEAPRPGEIARAGGRTLTSYRVAALPIINHVLEPCASTSFSARISHAPIDAAGSLPRSASRCCSRTCSSPASRCMASANGRPGSSRKHSGSPTTNCRP